MTGLEKVHLLPATAPIDGGDLDPIVICTTEDKERLRNLVRDVKQKTGYQIQFFERGPVSEP